MTTRSARFAAAFLGLFLLGVIPSIAQNTVREEVLLELEKIRPADNQKKEYRVEVPGERIDVPQNVRLDISFKEGHYSFSYVLWHFERTAGNNAVTVTRFEWRSSLAFYREYAGPDTYAVEQTQFETVEFDRLLTKAVLYYRSSITEKDICDCGDRCFCGGGGSYASSSGDGVVQIALHGHDEHSKLQIIENGTLHAGPLSNRISNGYEDIRIDLFHRVFADALSQYPRFQKVGDYSAETLAIQLLNEPYQEHYSEYYRLSALVQILGEIGTNRAVPVLAGFEKSNNLASSWNGYLSDNANAAIAKIKSRDRPN